LKRGGAINSINHYFINERNKLMNAVTKINKGLKVKSQVKAGAPGGSCPRWQCGNNHNETLVRAKGLKVKTQVKAGIQGEDDFQHNETLVRAKGLKVKTQVKSGINGEGGTQGCPAWECGSNHNETLVRN
jgi:hypothetical protein